jgi:hypothetical protein
MKVLQERPRRNTKTDASSMYMPMGATRIEACNDVIQVSCGVLMLTGLTKSYYGNKIKGVGLKCFELWSLFRISLYESPSRPPELRVCFWAKSIFSIHHISSIVSLMS